MSKPRFRVEIVGPTNELMRSTLEVNDCDLKVKIFHDDQQIVSIDAREDEAQLEAMGETTMIEY